MYIPRGKLLALVTIVVAASLVTATGAFSSVQTERTAEVNVVGDKNAYLGLNASNGPNGAYAEHGEDGKLAVKLNGDTDVPGGGQGVNAESVTRFDNVFMITNQGTQPVDISVEGGTEEAISLYRADGKGFDKRIGPGDHVKVGLKVDASDKQVDESFSEEITITATSPDSKEASLPGNGGDGSGNSNESEA